MRGGAVEVDALDAGLGVGAGEVAGHRDGLRHRVCRRRQAVVDDEIAGLGAGVVVEGVEAR